MTNKKFMTVEIEGCDGSGKTTLIKGIDAALKQTSTTHTLTREVGSQLVESSMKLREIVLNPAYKMDPRAMELVFAAMRVEQQNKLNGTINTDLLISDRGFASHIAYSNMSAGSEFTDSLYGGLIENITAMPQAVIYLDIDPQVALERRMGRGQSLDAIESLGVEYQQGVRESFLYDVLPQMIEKGVRVLILDGSASQTEVLEKSLNFIKELQEEGQNVEKQ